MHDVVAFQAAVVSKLQAHQGLAALTADIKELSYQGVGSTYPSVRVGRVFQTPLGNGPCHTENVTATFMVSTFSQNPSSKEASQLATQVVAALFGHQIKAATLRTLSIDVKGGEPYRWTPQLWRVDVQCTAMAYPI